MPQLHIVRVITQTLAFLVMLHVRVPTHATRRYTKEVQQMFGASWYVSTHKAFRYGDRGSRLQ